MSDNPLSGDIGLEVVAPDRSRTFVKITESPFLIGRAVDPEKHLQITDSRISRQCAAIVFEDERYYLEDRGQRHGIFLNNAKVTRTRLEEGDVITFGIDDFYEMIFRTTDLDTAIPDLLNRIENMSSSEASTGGLHKLNLLLEATALLHSRLPLDSVLGTMLDHAVAITEADRGLLFDVDASGSLHMRLARGSGGKQLPLTDLAPSQTAIRQALEKQSSVVTTDLAQAPIDLQAAPSVVLQSIRAVVVIPLYVMPRASSTESATRAEKGELLGAIYLDFRRPAAFSKLDRQILDALAVEAASMLENARLVERDRERRRLEQEIAIARDIQQALLPRKFGNFPHLAVCGTNLPCLSVGGDYFDVFPVSEGRTAFLIADVSGKGLGAALLATMLQGALLGMTIGADPARVFDQLSRFLCEHEEVGRYATVFFGILDRDGQIEFINAGHPSPFLLRRDYIAEPFTECCFPVGLIPEAEFTVGRAKLEPGDTLILFSDGLTEAANTRKQLFGSNRLRELLLGQHETPVDILQKTVLDSVQTFAHGMGQADDITLLLIRYNPTQPS
jgi:sigma-B regulation protein RsbU (phosphoserine phosphatase)